MDIQEDKDFAALPEVAKLYQACKERDLTIAEREYLKGARDAWQAAKAQAVHEQVIDAPACVGGGTFQKGVKCSTVIAAAQRHFKYTQNAKKAPSLDIDQVKKLVSGDFVLVPKEPSADLVNHGHQVFLGHFNEGGQTGGRSLYFAYKAMIEAQEPAND